jgi:hypothetical protein
VHLGSFLINVAAVVQSNPITLFKQCITLEIHNPVSVGTFMSNPAKAKTLEIHMGHGLACANIFLYIYSINLLKIDQYEVGFLFVELS